MSNTLQSFNHLRVCGDVAVTEAQALADLNRAPVGVWKRDGWYAVCDQAPDDVDADDENSPESRGWVMWAVVDPSEVSL